ESASAEHLLTGGEKRGGVHLRFDRINRTHRPKKGRAKQNEHPDSRTTGFVRPKIQGGSDQNSDTEETTCEAEPDDRGRPRRSAIFFGGADTRYGVMTTMFTPMSLGRPITCHPESRRRRGTSQSQIDFREAKDGPRS